MLIDRHAGAAGYMSADTLYTLTERSRALIGHRIEYYHATRQQHAVYCLEHLLHLPSVTAYEYGVRGGVEVGIGIHEISYHSVYAGGTETAAVAVQKFLALWAFLKRGDYQMRELQPGLD